LLLKSKTKGNLFGWIFLGLGGLLIITSFFLLPSSSPVSFSQEPELISSSAQVFPQRIKIACLGIDLPVYLVELTGDQWPLFEDGASYLVGSGQIGAIGNAVIYAHNKAHLFGPLTRIKNKDLIEIKDQEGKSFFYRVEKILTVSSSQVGVISATDYPALTLYTCTGFLDQKRLVVVSRLEKETPQLDVESESRL
jgi:LPXTG-site transpeptidase (sortase) family protein